MSPVKEQGKDERASAASLAHYSAGGRVCPSQVGGCRQLADLLSNHPLRRGKVEL